MNEKLLEIGKAAKEAAFHLASAGAKKDEALACMSEQLLADTPFILAENALDVENARAKGISEAMIDRLTLGRAARALEVHPDELSAALADAVHRFTRA